MTETRILIVEDETIVAKNIEKRLIAAGYKINGLSTTAEDAIEKIRNERPDLVLMDIKLKGKMDGIEAADIIYKSYRLPVIFLTSYTDEETFQRAKITEHFGYLIKPIDIKELNRAVEIAIYKNKIYKELLDTKLRSEIAIKAGKTGVWEFWPTEKKYYGDNNLKTLYGFDVNELSDELQDWSALVHIDDRELMSICFNDFLKSKRREFELEHRIYRKDGSVGWVVDNGLLFDEDKDKPLRLIGTTTDITERKEAEIELQKSEEKFRNVFENSGIGMAMLTPDGQITKVNVPYCEIMGYNEKRIIEKNIRDLIHPGDLESLINIMQGLLSRELNGSQHIEKRYLHKNGELIWAITTVSLVRDSDGKPLYFLIQVQDITHRKKAEEQLAKYAEELKTLNKSKDKFFSIISHDLRSPFNSLLGVTEYMSQYYKEMTPDEIKDSVMNIYKSSQKVYNLILNLLEWSRLQSGRLEVDKTNIDLKEIGDEIIGLYKEAAKSKQIMLFNRITDEVVVYADRYMIETVMRNLVSNAIKFTPHGGTITISAFEQPQHRMTEVSVSDTGIGISKANQKKLFRIDEQYRREGTADEKGTGLGLILCKEFIEKNGGIIRVESDEEKGSKFIFTIPLSSSRED
jgi:PAS domain S-box-containing protein